MWCLGQVQIDFPSTWGSDYANGTLKVLGNDFLFECPDWAHSSDNYWIIMFFSSHPLLWHHGPHLSTPTDIRASFNLRDVPKWTCLLHRANDEQNETPKLGICDIELCTKRGFYEMTVYNICHLFRLSSLTTCSLNSLNYEIAGLFIQFNYGRPRWCSDVARNYLLIWGVL